LLVYLALTLAHVTMRWWVSQTQSMEKMGPFLSVRCWSGSCCIRSLSLTYSEWASVSGPRVSPLSDSAKGVVKAGACIPRNSVHQSQDI